MGMGASLRIASESLRHCALEAVLLVHGDAVATAAGGRHHLLVLVGVATSQKGPIGKGRALNTITIPLGLHAEVVIIGILVLMMMMMLLLLLLLRGRRLLLLLEIYKHGHFAAARLYSAAGGVAELGFRFEVEVEGDVREGGRGKTGTVDNDLRFR